MSIHIIHLCVQNCSNRSCKKGQLKHDFNTDLFNNSGHKKPHRKISVNLIVDGDKVVVVAVGGCGQSTETKKL